MKGVEEEDADRFPRVGATRGPTQLNLFRLHPPRRHALCHGWRRFVLVFRKQTTDPPADLALALAPESFCLALALALERWEREDLELYASQDLETHQGIQQGLVLAHHAQRRRQLRAMESQWQGLSPPLSFSGSLLLLPQSLTITAQYLLSASDDTSLKIWELSNQPSSSLLGGGESIENWKDMSDLSLDLSLDLFWPSLLADR